MLTHSPTIKQLEALYWTAKLGSFQAAADKLCATQSAIAKRVNELESSFDMRLLDRRGNKSVLTLQGKEFLEHAEDVLDATSKLMLAMSNARELREGREFRTGFRASGQLLSQRSYLRPAFAAS